MTQSRLPPLSALRVFETAARVGSFSAAAKELHLTHSAISQQIRNLEDFIGRSLFIREARGVVLVPEANNYLEAIRASLDQIADATNALRSLTDQRSTLIVVTSPSLAMQWLIPKLSAFTLDFPNIELQLLTSSRYEIEHNDHDYDVIIESMPLIKSGYVCVRLTSDYALPVAAPGFLKQRRIDSAADCLGYPLLQTVGRMDEWPSWFQLALVDVPPVLPGPIFDHLFLCLHAAANEMGIALLPKSMVAHDLQVGRLVPLFDEPKLPQLGLHALVRTKLDSSGPANDFVHWLKLQPDN